MLIRIVLIGTELVLNPIKVELSAPYRRQF
jgi:hypothetical protein